MVGQRDGTQSTWFCSETNKARRGLAATAGAKEFKLLQLSGCGAASRECLTSLACLSFPYLTFTQLYQFYQQLHRQPESVVTIYFVLSTCKPAEIEPI